MTRPPRTEVILKLTFLSTAPHHHLLYHNTTVQIPALYPSTNGCLRPERNGSEKKVSEGDTSCSAHTHTKQGSLGFRLKLTRVHLPYFYRTLFGLLEIYKEESLSPMDLPFSTRALIIISMFTELCELNSCQSVKRKEPSTEVFPVPQENECTGFKEQ